MATLDIISRGAMYDGGMTKWTDATSLDELVAKMDDEGVEWDA